MSNTNSTHSPSKLGNPKNSGKKLEKMGGVILTKKNIYRVINLLFWSRKSKKFDNFGWVTMTISPWTFRRSSHRCQEPPKTNSINNLSTVKKINHSRTPNCYFNLFHHSLKGVAFGSFLFTSFSPTKLRSQALKISICR